MIKKDTDAKKMETQLKNWGKKLDKLSAQAEDAKEEVRTDFLEQIKELKVTYAKAEAKLAEFKKAGSGKWDVFKGDMEVLWEDIASTFNRLKK